MPAFSLRFQRFVGLLTAVAVASSAPVASGAQNPDGSLGGRPVSVPSDTNTLAILPFNVSGPPDAAYLGESMMDLLAMALDGRAGIKVLYPQFVLRQVGIGARRTDPTAAAPIVRDLGAGRVIGGTVAVAGTQLRISVDVFDARRATLQFPLRAQSTVDGLAAAADTLASLLLARRLVPARVLQQRGIADYATSSADALRAVLIGEQAMRRGEYKVAADSLKSALRLDPDFGLAHQRIIDNEGKQAGAAGPGLGRSVLVDSASRRMAKFTPRIRRLIEYSQAYDAGERYRAIQIANQMATDYPVDGGALALRADAHFHFGLNIGVPLPAVIDMFHAALRIDDGNVELLQHFAPLLMRLGDTTAALSVWRRCNAVRADACGSGRGEIDVLYHGARPWAEPVSEATLRRLLDIFFLGAAPERLPFAAALIDSSAVAITSSADLSAGVRRSGFIHRQLMAYLTGRYDAAWQLMDSIGAIGAPDPVRRDAWVRMHAILTRQHRDAALATLASPQPAAGNIPRRSSRAWYAMEFLPADSAEPFVGELSSSNRSDSTLMASIVTGLRGIQALRGGDTTRARDRLAEALQNHGRRTLAGLDRPLWPANAFVYEMARIQYARRDFVGARRTLLDLQPAFDGVLFLAQAEELRANVELALGDTTAARVALRNFVGLWDKADPPLQPRVTAARALLTRIGPR